MTTEKRMSDKKIEIDVVDLIDQIEDPLAGEPDVIPANGSRWGQWELCTTEPPSLDYIDELGRHAYEIALNRIFSSRDTYRSSPGLVTWIKHLHGKIWGQGASMADFVDAVLTIGRYGYMNAKNKHVTVCRKDASEQ